VRERSPFRVAVRRPAAERHLPEKTFNEAAEHILYQANNYSVWLAKGKVHTRGGDTLSARS